MALTTEERDALPDEMFAVPGKRELPINDVIHTRLAWDMVDRTAGLTAAERKSARTRIVERAHHLGISTKGWHIAAMQISAMSLDMPKTADHPNRVPFSGILVHLDRASDASPHGADGKMVFMSKAVAKEALPSLLGMGVDAADDLGGHNPQKKIGVITDAEIEGDSIAISGFLYAKDFPKEVKEIQANKDKLGFSFECDADVCTTSTDPLEFSSVQFTGAAILYKDKAAFTTTSIAAAAQEGQMDKEILKKFEEMEKTMEAQAKELAELKKKQEDDDGKGKKIEAGSVEGLVRPHSDRIREVADKLEKSGLGMHERRGHVAVLRRMADDMDARAIKGELPHAIDNYAGWYDASAQAKTDPAVAELHAKVDSLTVKLADAEKIRFTAAAAPERVTLDTASANALRKMGIQAGNDGKIPGDVLRKAFEDSNIPTQQRIEMKLSLEAAGLL